MKKYVYVDNSKIYVNGNMNGVVVFEVFAEKIAEADKAFIEATAEADKAFIEATGINPLKTATIGCRIEPASLTLEEKTELEHLSNEVITDLEAGKIWKNFQGDSP